MHLGSLDVRLVLGVTGACALLYKLLCRQFPHRRSEWHCRSVTVLHGITVTGLGLWCALMQGPWPFTDAGGPNTPMQVVVISICLGYFLFDFSWCIIFQTEGLTMMMHHSLSIVGLTWCLVSGKYGTEMVATIVGTEVSNPLLQLRWYLRETGKYESLLGEVVDAAFMATFGIMRIGVGSNLLYCYYQQPTDVYGRLGGTCIYLISWAFWVNILQYAAKKYRKKLQRWRGNASRPDVSAPTLASHGQNQSAEPVGPQSRKSASPCASDLSMEIETSAGNQTLPVSRGEASVREVLMGDPDLPGARSSSEVIHRKAGVSSESPRKDEVHGIPGLRINGLLTCQNGGGVVEQMLHDVENVVSSGGMSSKKES